MNLPVSVSQLIVTGDDTAVGSVDGMVLVPSRRLKTEPTPSLRGRDAARYGSTVVYALDDRVWLEPGGFWVMGERQPDVLFAPDASTDHLDVSVQNGPVSNRVRLRSGEWSAEHVLAGDEAWAVRIPIADSSHPVIVNFDVEHGVQPAHIDPSSTDRRLLGCWIELR
jgi:hypothetical protein